VATATVKSSEVEVTLTIAGQQAADLKKLLGDMYGTGPVMGYTIVPIYKALDDVSTRFPKPRDHSMIGLMGGKLAPL
jgi:hypothetical protein